MRHPDSTVDSPSAALESPRAPTPTLRLALVTHPDLARIGAGLVMRPGTEALISRLAPALDDGQPLDDRSVSRDAARLRARPDGLELGPRWTVDGQPVDSTRLLPWSAFEAGAPPKLLGLGRKLSFVVELERGAIGGGTWFGRSLAARRVAARVELLAGTTTPVLVRGPTGAGKERVARALHERGPCARGPFVSVNLATIPATTAAAALFGHVKGAYTGADTAGLGLFGAAHGGTLFLDEVATASLEVQDQLLRAVELGEILPVGARGPRTVDVRVVAATDDDLETAMAGARFRRPLYFRLAAHSLRVPPLSERLADIAPLFVGFVRAERQVLGLEHPLELPSALLAGLLGASLEGNVRELMALAAQWVVDPHHAPAAPAPKPPALRLDAATVTEALAASGGVLTQAARSLGVSNAALHQFLGRTGLQRRACDITPEELAAALNSTPDVAEAARQLGVTLRGLQLRLARERKR